MYNTPLASEHYTIEDLGSTLHITSPSRKNWYVIIAYALIAPIFLIAVILLESTLIIGQAKSSANFMGILVLNLLFFLSYGTVLTVEWLWQLVGKEIIEINEEQISLCHRIFSFGLSKHYAAISIKGVFISRPKRAWPGLFSWWSAYRRLTFFNFKLGKIGFNLRKQTFRFGVSLNEEEAKQIVIAIHERFPQYLINK